MSIDKNNVISFVYEAKDAVTNEVVDGNKDENPIEFIPGNGHIIEKLEEEILKLDVDATSDILVKKEDAYGVYDEDAKETLPKEQFAGIDLHVGMVLYGTGENGETTQVKVISMVEDDVEIDYNHPLAGKDLIFNVNILSARVASAEEVSTGIVGGAKSGGSCGTGCGCH
jgi:FKBP-type peptidyl-prolyl cis-trans isomerase SlyD